MSTVKADKAINDDGTNVQATTDSSPTPLDKNGLATMPTPKDYKVAGTEINPSEKPAAGRARLVTYEPSKMRSMADIADYLEERASSLQAQMPTDEQLAKEARRSRTNRIISSIADTSRALSNLFFATKGAPNMYNAGSNTSDAYKQRYEKYLDDYKAKREDFLNYALRGAQLRESVEDKQYERERKEFEDSIKAAKAAQEARLSDLRAQRLSNQIDDAEYTRQQKEANEAYEAQLKQAKLDLVKAQTQRANRTGNGRSGGGGRTLQDYTVTRERTYTGSDGQKRTDKTVTTRTSGAKKGSGYGEDKGKGAGY